MKGYVAATKPPSGRNSAGPASNRSLNKSTSSLYIANGVLKPSGPPSLTKKDTSLTRHDSDAHSWRGLSFEGKTRSSSIPVSKGSPSSPASKYLLSSPVAKPKRDSLTNRVKNLDSLSRLQSTVGSSPTLTANGSGNVGLYKKKELSASTTSVTSQNGTNGNNTRKTTALPVRRSSNVSVGRSNSENDQATDGSSAKVRNIRSSFWNWLKI